jgi:hypothetical protein
MIKRAELLPKQLQRRDFPCEGPLTSNPELRSIAHDDGKCPHRATHKLDGKCYCMRHASIKALQMLLDIPPYPVSLRITTPTKTLELIATSIEIVK